MYSRKVVIRYPAESAEKPIIHELVKKHDLLLNILKARIFPRQEGVLVLELSGEKENFDNGIRSLEGQGLNVEPLSKSVSRNEEPVPHSPNLLKRRHSRTERAPIFYRPPFLLG